MAYSIWSNLVLHCVLHSELWHKESACVLGCRGVKKNGGEVKLNAHVDKILLEKKKAAGVLLKDGTVIKASKVGCPTLPAHVLRPKPCTFRHSASYQAISHLLNPHATCLGMHKQFLPVQAAAALCTCSLSGHSLLAEVSVISRCTMARHP